MRGQFDVRQADAYFLDLQAHAERSSVARDQRSNTPFSSSAVSRGRSSGNMWPPGSDMNSPRGIARISRVWCGNTTLLCRPRTIASGTCNCRARPGLLCGTLR